MKNDEIRARVLEVLARIAPELDPAELAPGENLRDQLDVDSMDFLNFVIAMHDRLGVDVPEVDYPRLHTLDGAVAYLVSKAGGLL